MSMYNIVHTIGNKIAGGARGGLFKTEKVSIEFLVSNPAKIPTRSGKAMDLSRSFRFSVKRNALNFIGYPF